MVGQASSRRPRPTSRRRRLAYLCPWIILAGIAEIVPAALGEEVVIHGALALARASFHQEPELKPFAPDGEPE